MVTQPFPEIPGYRIEKKLGRGGMASVYLAFQEKLERRVALKVLSPALAEDPSVTRRFLSEAKIAAQLHHANIISIHDVGRHRGLFYFAMEYLPRSLKDILRARKEGRIQPEVALNLTRQIAAALDYAHRKGVVHRDVKPANILLRNDGSPVLVDFGIAKLMDSGDRLTRTGTSVGTPHYMSPEQIQGQDLDGRSDFYSLGVVLYEMLQGEVPFSGGDSVAIAVKHVRDPIPRMDDDLAAYQPVVERLMAKDPAQRLQNGTVLNDLLRDGPPPADTSEEITVIRRAKRREKKIKKSPGERGRGFRLAPTGRIPLRWVVPAFLVLGVAVVFLIFNPFGSPTLHPGDDPAWEQARTEDTIEAYARYTERFPHGRHTKEAQERILAEKREREAVDPDHGGGVTEQEAAEDESGQITLLRSAGQALERGDLSAARALLTQAERFGRTEDLISLETRLNEAEAQRRSRAGLRRTPRDLTGDQVEAMLRSRGLYDIHKNRQKTFRNRFRLGRSQGEAVVVDNASALMWLQSGSPRYLSLAAARAWIEGLNRRGHAGYRDWRLPTLEEAASLLEPRRNPSGLFIHPMFEAKIRNIWTADTLGPQCWIVYFEHGYVDVNWPQFNGYVRPVRTLN